LTLSVERMPAPLAKRAAAALADPLQRSRRLWKRIRGWRRIRFTGGGVAFTIGVCAVGFAAVNAGNNLLHLMLGAMLGLIVVSGWMSERMIRDLEVEREIPRGVTAGQEFRIGYRVHNRRKRLASVAVEVGEESLAEKAFLIRLAAGESTQLRSYHRAARRGVYPLETVTLSTGFPFGLFIKERDVTIPGELIVWPRSDRPVRPPKSVGRRRSTATELSAPGSRGEYRSLREYRVGDDARDIHWKSSARLRAPVVREYDTDSAEDFWICLDTAGRPGEAAEDLVEIAASLAARAVREGRRFGLVLNGPVLLPSGGARHLETALDLLARVEFSPDAPPPAPPTGASSCVLVSAGSRGGEGFVDVYTARAT
jgi:uncharacterized protein (DUF58 family)